MLVTYSPIRSGCGAKQWWLQEKSGIGSRSLEELNVVLLHDAGMSNAPGRQQRNWKTKCVERVWGIRRGSVKGGEASQRKKYGLAKKRGLIVGRGKGHRQENWFLVWSRLSYSYLCSRARGIHLRAAAQKMTPVRMISLRLYFIRFLYIILLQWNLSLQSNIFIFPYC